MADVFDPNVFDPGIFDAAAPVRVISEIGFGVQVVTGAVALAVALAVTVGLPAPTVTSGGQVVLASSVRVASFVGGETALKGPGVSQGTNRPPGPMVFCLGQLFSDDERWVVVRRRFTMKGDGRITLTMERDP